MSDLLSGLKPAKPKAQPKSAPVVAPGKDHVCAVCGEHGSFGFGVSIRRGTAGRWSCLAHREDVGRMA